MSFKSDEIKTDLAILRAIRDGIWLSLSEHVRRGLTRLYLVVSVPWVAWFGHLLFDALQQDDQDLASDAFWFLLIVPIGVPIVGFAVLWVIAGFRKREPASTSKDDNNPPNPWGRPAKEPAGPSLLEKAIRDFEGFKKYIHEFKVEPGPASTVGLLLSIYFFPKFWMLDATSMSLYWVARLPKPPK
jgi:hypothetical protein